MSTKKEKISDELLARYLDGKTDEKETRLVADYLSSDEEALNEAIMASREIAFQQMTQHQSVYGKSLLSKEDLDDDVRYQIAGHGKQTMAARTTEQTCAIQAQQLVLQNYGIDVSTDELIDVARQNGWFIDKVGSPLDFVGELLNYYKVPAVQMRNANMYHIMHELSQGHKIIVGIDDNDLSQSEKWRHYEDVMIGKEANHVLVVAGIDTTNPDDVKVVITDPTKKDSKKIYPAKQFLEAWEDSGYFMVSTNKPAPLTINPEMENFDYEKGYVQKFANLAYTEIVRRLAEEGYIQQDGNWKKIRTLLVYIIVFLLFACTSVLAWRFFTPISMRINMIEDSLYQIPAMPFETGTISISYAGKPMQTFTISKDNMMVLLDDIHYKYKNKKVHIVFESVGYQQIDTILAIKGGISLPIRRNNDLGVIFGSVIDGKTGLPLQKAEISIQDIVTQTDMSGKFKVEIPFAKQAKFQRMQVFKEGYPLWVGTYQPSASNAWEIVMEK